MKTLFTLALLFLVACTKNAEPVPVVVVTEGENAATPTAETPLARAAESKCDKALDAIPAFDEKSEMFTKIFEFYKEYDECMDAGIAEGMQALTTTVLAKKWGELPKLNKLIVQDKSFKSFVLSNINSSVTGLTSEVNSLIEKSEKSCAKDLRSLCLDIKKSAQNALESEREEMSR